MPAYVLLYQPRCVKVKFGSWGWGSWDVGSEAEAGGVDVDIDIYDAVLIQ
jgi:hypothetical protein